MEIDRNNPVQTPPARNAMNRNLFNGKELQVGSGYIDYGSRMYMPEIGRWGAVDGKADLQEMASPYNYSLNSPLNYVDRDGQLPIFINGRVASNSERASSSYWDTGLIATIKNSGIPNPGGESHFVDGDRYATYSRGRTYIDNGGWLESGTNSPSQRHTAGYKVAQREFSTIMDKLARDPKSGKITEKIQIYTHSRGAAFASGYVEALLDLISQNASQFSDSKNAIDFVYNMAPHQSNEIKSPSGVDEYSSDHTWDPLSGNDMKGIRAAFKSNDGGSPLGQHATKSFVKDATSFTRAFLKNGSNSTKLVEDFVKRMKSDYGINVTVSK